MKYFNHLIALILFFPMTISFTICMVFEIFYNISQFLHPKNFKQIDVNEVTNFNIPENRFVLIFFLKILIIVIDVLITFKNRMKEIATYDFMTKDEPK